MINIIPLKRSEMNEKYIVCNINKENYKTFIKCYLSFFDGLVLSQFQGIKWRRTKNLSSHVNSPKMPITILSVFHKATKVVIGFIWTSSLLELIGVDAPTVVFPDFGI